MLELNQIYNMDCIELIELIKHSGVKINCCVTSPPYFALRDYGIKQTMWPAIKYRPMPGIPFEFDIPEWTGCLGLEPTPEMYIGHLVYIFRKLREVMQDDGTLWLNLGDSYAGGGRNSGNSKPHPKAYKGLEYLGDKVKMNVPHGLKAKDLMGIPWRAAYALQADGWYLRSDIIWSKPNAMPENVTDRPTKAHEYIFLLTKKSRYYYDYEAIKEPCTQGERKKSGNVRRKFGDEHGRPGSHIGNSIPWEGNMRNKRSVWNIATKPFPEAHFATFPPDLVEPCIKAGCPVGGTVIDLFMGSGTTAMKAIELQRNFLGSELNPEYIKISDEVRLNVVQIKMTI